MILLKRCVYIYVILLSHFLFGESFYTLCLDGGGSKTLLQVINPDGTLAILYNKDGYATDRIITTCTNINTVGVEGVKDIVKNLFENVSLEKDSIALTDILTNCHVVAGIAAAEFGNHKQAMISIFEEWGVKREHIHIFSDSELALELVEDPGIILICGTGSVCLGKKDRKLCKVGGLGRILGDEGSGYHIGLQALKAALAEEYGWGSATTLTPTLKEFFYVDELQNLIPEINSDKILPAQIASIAPIVFREAQKGDLLSKEIINRAVDEIMDLLSIQLNKLQISNCELHVWGGIFKSIYKDWFIQKILENMISRNIELKIINNSEQNPAVLFTYKFLLR